MPDEKDAIWKAIAKWLGNLLNTLTLELVHIAGALLTAYLMHLLLKHIGDVPSASQLPSP